MNSLKDNLPQKSLDALKSAKENLEKDGLNAKHKSKKKRIRIPAPIEVGNIYKISQLM